MKRRNILIILLLCWSIKTQAESFVDLKASFQVVWGRNAHYDPGCENITGWIIIYGVDWKTYQPPVCDVYFIERHRCDDRGLTWVYHNYSGHFFLRNFHIIENFNEKTYPFSFPP